MKLRLPALALVLVLLLAVLPSGARAAFSDVKPSDWFYQPVTAMEARGALSGYPDGAFRPKGIITRAEFVAVTARMAGLSPAEGQTGHWAAGTLQAALEAGWYDWDEIPPTGETFNDPIPRQLAVKILMKALLPQARGDYNTESAKMADFSSLDGRYYEAVLAAYAAGVVNGDDRGNFNPRSHLSRAEACALFLRAGDESARGQTRPVQPAPVPAPGETVRGGVTENGWLRVEGTQLCSEAGRPLVLRGMSSHGMQWYGPFASPQAIRNTAAFGANVFRVAMYTGEGGYLSQPAAMKAKVIAAVDAAIEADLYVIIDWHILSDGNPRTNQAQAVAFFAELSKRYAHAPAVLYEICNEPNGAVSWSGDVKPYAQAVVKAIRANSPRSVILIGSPTWSQDIHLAAADPVAGDNLMYTLHFYAGTHGQWLRDRITQAQAQGLPVFVSEWGTSRADGGGGVFPAETKAWLDYLDAWGISWCNWSLCDKDESSAALKPGTPANRAWTAADLSESGRLVFGALGG